jgi:hypothetical protein
MPYKECRTVTFTVKAFDLLQAFKTKKKFASYSALIERLLSRKV